METAAGFRPQSAFPTKASMRGERFRTEARAVSNHFQISLADEKIPFGEWHMGFVKKEDLERFLAEPELMAADAVPPDSRFLIGEIVKANRKQLLAKLGKTFTTGVTLYSLKEAPGTRVICDGHAKFVLLLSKKNAASELAALALGRDTRPQFLRFMNAAIKSMLKGLDFIELGRNKKYYNPGLAERVRSGPHNFIILKGFKTAFDVYEGGLRLLVDYSTRVIREQSLWEEVRGFREQNQADEDIIESLIKGRSVLTMYGSQRIYRVDEVLYHGRISDPFPDPAFPTFAAYFSQRYKLELRYKDQFLLVHHKPIVERDARGNELSRRIEKVVLLPELVRATGLTDEMRGDFRIMKDIGQHTILNPQRRFDEVDRILRSLNKSPPNGFNFRIDDRSNTIAAARLQTPRILTGNGQSQLPSDRINLGELAEDRPLRNWVLVYDPYLREHLGTLVNNLGRSCGRYRIKFAEPGDEIPLERRDRAADVESHIRRSREPDPDIIFFFVGRRNANSVYKEMKRHFNARGVITQFFVSFNPAKDSQGLSKYGNLLLQMVNKMGCNLWYVDRLLKHSLVLGADVYHAKGNKSVVGVTGQFDEYFKRSYSLSQIQPRENQIIMRNVAGLVLEQVDYFVHRNKEPPRTLVFYRDGVGEGQLPEVLSCEVKTIENKLAEVYGPKKPGLVFVVITKRIDDRFAVKAQDGLRNPDGGLVVSGGVVKPDHANFFMIAQKVTQGTANPTHYEVLYNSAGMELGELISVTYELTWGYSNWLGPVKVPAPVQYAKKLCSLIGITQEANIPRNLKTTRFYM